MGEEAYQIKDYFHDEAVAFAGAMHLQISAFKTEKWTRKRTSTSE
ncbi:hypothetical protein [uncultured Prochlorococcus sp.]|nr:hypothetical protein [uncultured Prochlorococcus sp.]